MRLFVAVYPPPHAVADLATALQSVSAARDMRWTRSEHWHVTLAFLGDVPDTGVGDLDRALAAVAGDAAPLRLRLRGAGRFSSRGRGDVVWAGVAGDVERLMALSSSVGVAARAAGVTYPDRRPEPHLTLGRQARGSGAAAQRVIEALASYDGPVWPVEEVRLVRSTLGPPLVHAPLSTWPLGPT
ncbi:MAG TPA: RNA 2',3'-cyclic phosphodiesterase [Mycobacteriales bacterium]|nr:RNA 2',3'-cyclic phosphodiesterase [Mycobacteriales bacterium]